MKNIRIYKAGKYDSDKYEEVKENIYKTYDSFMNQDAYVTSLSFEQEPEYEEGADSSDISQYPLVLLYHFVDPGCSDSYARCGLFIEDAALGIYTYFSLFLFKRKHHTSSN